MRKRNLCWLCAQTAIATSPTAKLSSIAFYYNLDAISPKSTLTPIRTHFIPLSCEPLVDLSLVLKKCHEPFGDASYHRDWIHCEQTDILRDIDRYPIPPTPILHPSPTLSLCPPQSHVDLLLDLGKCHVKFGDATSYRDWIHSEETERQTLFFI